VNYVRSPNGALNHGNAASPVTSTTAPSVDAKRKSHRPIRNVRDRSNDLFHLWLDEGRNFFRQNKTLRFAKHSVDDLHSRLNPAIDGVLNTPTKVQLSAKYVF